MALAGHVVVPASSEFSRVAWHPTTGAPLVDVPQAVASESADVVVMLILRFSTGVILRMNKAQGELSALRSPGWRR
jgi:hypothetical protein